MTLPTSRLRAAAFGRYAPSGLSLPNIVWAPPVHETAGGHAVPKAAATPAFCPRLHHSTRGCLPLLCWSRVHQMSRKQGHLAHYRRVFAPDVPENGTSGTPRAQRGRTRALPASSRRSPQAASFVVASCRCAPCASLRPCHSAKALPSLPRGDIECTRC